MKPPGRKPDRGSASLEMAVIMPVVLLLTFGPIQAGFWFHGRSVILAAAQECARATATVTGTTADGAAAGASFAARAGNGLVNNISVAPSRTATTARCTITANGMSLVPGFPVAITQTASVPVERIT